MKTKELIEIDNRFIKNIRLAKKGVIIISEDIYEDTLKKLFLSDKGLKNFAGIPIYKTGQKLLLTLAETLLKDKFDEAYVFANNGDYYIIDKKFFQSDILTKKTMGMLEEGSLNHGCGPDCDNNYNEKIDYHGFDKKTKCKRCGKENYAEIHTCTPGLYFTTEERLEGIYEKIATKRNVGNEYEGDFYIDDVLIGDILKYFGNNGINCVVSVDGKIISNKNKEGSCFEIQFDDISKGIDEQSEEAIELLYNLISE